MKSAVLTVALAGALGAGGAYAQSGADLVKSKGCLGCHDMETKKVGPSIKEIAAKKGNKDALVAKLKEGKGHMKVTASDAELNTMVQYMLAAK